MQYIFFIQLSSFSSSHPSIQYLSHLSGQTFQCKRLLDKRKSLLQNPVMKNHIIRITRHIQSLRFRMDPPKPLHQLPTTHPGHHHIR